MAKPKAISLFSGCGGSDLAVKNCGFDIVWANDVSEVACETYRDNINPSKIVCGDIADFDEFPHADLQFGCYPCQGYSQGGKRNPEDPLNYLYRHFDRALRIVRPKAFVVENVSGMAYGTNRTLLMNQVYRYRMAGYRVVWSLLDAKDYGVPQTRRRVFIVGIRSDIDATYQFPTPTHGPQGTQPYVTQLDAIGEMPSWPEGEFNPELFHWYYLSRKRRYPWDQPSPCIVGHWRHVPLHPMSPPLKRIHTDKWVFEYDGPARRMSFRECASLQGFPSDFRWSNGDVREKFQMIGNAVPPPLFSAVLSGLDGLWRSA